MENWEQAYTHSSEIRNHTLTLSLEMCQSFLFPLCCTDTCSALSLFIHYLTARNGCSEREKETETLPLITKSFSTFHFSCCEESTQLFLLSFSSCFTGQFHILISLCALYPNQKPSLLLPSLSPLPSSPHHTGFMKQLGSYRTENKLGVHNFKHSLTKATRTPVPRVCLAGSKTASWEEF